MHKFMNDKTPAIFNVNFAKPLLFVFMILQKFRIQFTFSLPPTTTSFPQNQHGYRETKLWAKIVASIKMNIKYHLKNSAKIIGTLNQLTTI